MVLHSALKWGVMRTLLCGALCALQLDLPVVQSSRNIAKIIKITEKKGFRSLIGVNIENSAKNVIKLANFKAYID